MSSIDGYQRIRRDIRKTIAREARATALTAWGSAVGLLALAAGFWWGFQQIGPATTAASAALSLAVWGLRFWRDYRRALRWLEDDL